MAKNPSQILKKNSKRNFKYLIWLGILNQIVLPHFLQILQKKTIYPQPYSFEFPTIIISFICGMQVFMGLKKQKGIYVYSGTLLPILVNTIRMNSLWFLGPDSFFNFWFEKTYIYNILAIVFLYQLIFEYTQYTETEKEEMLTKERSIPMMITITYLAILSLISIQT